MKRNNRLTALAALVLGLVSSCKAADCSHESGDQQCGYADVSPRRVSLLYPVQTQTRRNSSWGLRESLGRSRL